MGLRYSGMIRLYKAGSKQILMNKFLKILPQIASSESAEDFNEVHNKFCDWAMDTIYSSRSIVHDIKISYGQAAKTLDVTLKVLVYYCGWPEPTKSTKFQKWIHAAIDNDMMRHLKKTYQNAFKRWPKSVQSVDKRTYRKLQDLVKRFIKEEDTEIKLPVHFDDKYWYLLKEGLLLNS
jgi:hypothetical protein